MKKFLAGLLGTAALSCAHSGGVDVATLSSNSDQVVFEAGEKADQHHLYEDARKYFKRIIDGFPQSTYGPAARLALADSHFHEGGTSNYILAVSSYRDFLTLYPSHPKSAYAQFQVGECFYHQKNTPDRDQTSTEKALEEFQRLLEIYPDSSFVEQARARVVACRQSLARSEFLVGWFYQHSRKAYRSAVIRYEGLTSAYPDYDKLDEVDARLAESLALSARCPEALPVLAKLRENFPKSVFVPSADATYQKACSKPAAAPSPAPPASAVAAPTTPASPAPLPSPSPSPLG